MAHWNLTAATRQTGSVGGYTEAGKTHYGYRRHTFMEGKFKGVRNEPDKLLCVDGTWKTGYEHLGLDVSGVCVLQDGKLCHLLVHYENTSMQYIHVAIFHGCKNVNFQMKKKI